MGKHFSLVKKSKKRRVLVVNLMIYLCLHVDISAFNFQFIQKLIFKILNTIISEPHIFVHFGMWTSDHKHSINALHIIYNLHTHPYQYKPKRHNSTQIHIFLSLCHSVIVSFSFCESQNITTAVSANTFIDLTEMDIMQYQNTARQSSQKVPHY